MKLKCSILILLAFSCLNAAVAVSAQLKRINVNKGDTLNGLAKKYLKDPAKWPEIYRYNKDLIPDPDLILPESVINIPYDMVKEELIGIQIVEFKNDVSIRKKHETEWLEIRNPGYLDYDDVLKTGLNSYITIKLETGEKLRIGENSLAVLRPQGEKEIELISGKIRSNSAVVKTASALIRPDKNYNTDFTAEINGNNSTLVDVYEGQVKVGSSGKEVIVRSGYSIEVVFGKPPMMPVLTSNREVHLNSSDYTEGGYFHLQLSIDRSFENIIYDELFSVDNTTENFWKYINSSRRSVKAVPSVSEFFKDMLNKAVTDQSLSYGDGLYYWRLFSADTLGIMKVTSPKSFSVDSCPPEIELSEPNCSEIVCADVVAVKGCTEKDSKVLINGKPAVMNGRDFRLYIPLKPGINPITIESFDKAGNKESIFREIVRQ